MKKGVSPLISSVLMITFVIVIGLAVSQWSDELIGGSIEKSQIKIGSDLECANVNIKLSADKSDSKLIIQNNNQEKLDLKGFITRFVMKDNTVAVDYAKKEEGITYFNAYIFEYRTSQKKGINGEDLTVGINDVNQIEIIPRVDVDGVLVNCESKKVKFKIINKIT